MGPVALFLLCVLATQTWAWRDDDWKEGHAILHPSFDSQLSMLQSSPKMRPGNFGKLGARMERYGCVDLHCESCKGMLDYGSLWETAGNSVAGLLLGLAWVLFILWLLNSTAEHFFLPPLMYWSEFLGLRPDVAGATIVAFGNGCPDFFAMMAALTEADDVPLALSEQLGSMMAGMCLAGGAVIGAASYTSVKNADGSWSSEVSLPTVFGLFVAMAYFSALLAKCSASLMHLAIMPLLYIFYLIVLTYSNVGAPAKSRHEVNVQIRNAEEAERNEVDAHQPSSRRPLNADQDQPQDGLSTTSDETAARSPAGCPPLVGFDDYPKTANAVDLALWFLAWPTFAFRWALIPPSDLYWDRSRRIVSSFAPLAVFLSSWAYGMLTLEGQGLWLLLALLAASVLFSVCIYATSNDGPEPPFYYALLVLQAKITSVVAMGALAAELVAFLEAVAVAKHIPRLWFASTVIPWGNSIGDIVTGIAMVQEGQAAIAFSLVLASPLFNCLVGGGIALTVAAGKEGGTLNLCRKEDSWTSDKDELTTTVAFILAAWGTLAYVVTRRTVPKGRFGILLLVIYCAFLVTVIFKERKDTTPPT